MAEASVENLPFQGERHLFSWAFKLRPILKPFALFTLPQLNYRIGPMTGDPLVTQMVLFSQFLFIFTCTMQKKEKEKGKQTVI